MDGVKELRLAVVLYGGVSLAIYMHGAAKELQRLVRGSALPAGSSEATPSDAVYRDLLAAKAREDGVATRVVIDTIAGTSAGGINGVYLAKALARDLSQDALRDLWLRRGDMDVLVRGPGWLPWPLRLPWVVATLWHRPLLQGGPMCGWLYDALADMDRLAVDGASLLPPDHDLELFVTLTDLRGYRRDVVIDDPPVVAQRQHRHVMAFRHGRGHHDFGPEPDRNAALAFSARATSSLPGGFPAVALTGFEAELRRRSGVDVDLSAPALAHLFRRYQLADVDARAAHFVDGGVLDNKPFGHALEAIQHKRAAVQVDRRLVYLDPDPADGALGDAADSEDEAGEEAPEQPSPLATALGALGGARGNEPILDDILALRQRNARVRHLRDVIESSWPAVADVVEQRLGAATLDAPPACDDATWRRWNEQLHEGAQGAEGLAYASYVRAKVADAIDHWAGVIGRRLGYPRDSHHAAFVARALHTRARLAGLYAQGGAAPSAAQTAFLGDLDLGYRERRVRFVLAALAWWYRPEGDDIAVPSRRQLDEAGQRLSDHLEELLAAMRGEDLPAGLAEQLRACFGEDQLADVVHHGQAGVQRLLERAGGQLDALETAFRAHTAGRWAGFGPRVYEELRQLTADWPVPARRRLLIRYLGFPVWDSLLFPLESMAAVAEQDEVEITRLSPRDVDLLPAVDAGAKLAGSTHHHLGAFFTRAGRERDYLWGRLDTAERMIGLLLGRDHPDFEGWCHRAFDAILAEEAGALDHARDLITHLRAHVAARRPAAEAATP